MIIIIKLFIFVLVLYCKPSSSGFLKGNRKRWEEKWDTKVSCYYSSLFKLKITHALFYYFKLDSSHLCIFNYQILLKNKRKKKPQCQEASGGSLALLDG